MSEIGQTISHYRITEKLGQGGMGEVFLAHDTSLDRKVALKFLPDIFSGDPERLARFEREAKLPASLNHSNIAAIYGLEQADGKRFLAMELVEGEPLAQQIERGPLPIIEALEVCRQIAEGLEAAHEKGVIHRDLKPANVMITPEGKVKILDFGLGKAFQTESASVDASKSPTLADQMTQAGVILGTAAYMAPEQAKGRAVDKRADIWAFGCVLYECLAGKRAFGGETVTETLAAILMRDPDWEALPATVPAQIKNLLRRCLQKDAKRRLRDIGDAVMEIEMPARDPAQQDAAPSKSNLNRWLVAGIALALIAGAAIGAWIVWYLLLALSGDTGMESRLYIPLEGDQRIQVYYNIPSLAISNDGRRIAWVAGKGVATQIFTRTLERLEIQPIPGTKNVFPQTLSVSPDGEWVCFPRGNVLFKIPVSGGNPTSIFTAEKPSALLFGLRWTNKGIIVATSNTGLQMISEDGKTKQDLTKLDQERKEVVHGGPRMLPDGKILLFLISAGNLDNVDIHALNLDSGRHYKILENVGLVQYLSAGHLIFASNSSFYAAPFDPGQMKAGGWKALQIPVQMDSRNLAGFWDVSGNGNLVYVPYDPAISLTHLEWIDLAGKREPLNLPNGKYFSPTLASEGNNLAYGYLPAGGAASQIWTFDITRRVPEQFTHSGKTSDTPVWRPGRSQLVFRSNAMGQFNLYAQDMEKKAEPSPLHKSNSMEFPHSFSPDGRYLLFTERALNDQFDLRLLDMAHSEAGPTTLAATPARESFGRFNPRDARWVAYTSDEEGGQFEIFVKEVIPNLPKSGRNKKVSLHGGVEPVWSPNGDEIFYRNVEGTKLCSVSFRAQPNLDLGQERERLANLSLPQFDLYTCATSYDISPDGKRFIMVIAPENANLASNLIVVQNWLEELKRLGPVK